MRRGDDLDEIGDKEREYDEREDGDDDQLGLLLRLRLCLEGDRSLGSGTLSYFHQLNSPSPTHLSNLIISPQILVRAPQPRIELMSKLLSPPGVFIRIQQLSQ